MELLVGVVKGFKLGMVTMGLCCGAAPHLWVWPRIYGADLRIYGAGRCRWSCWWG